MKLIGLAMVFIVTYVGLGLTAGFEKATHLVTGVILPMLPGEGMIIIGLGIVAFVIANTKDNIKHTLKYFNALTKPTEYDKKDYIELLSVLYMIFKLAKTKGFLALETHIENPEDSDLFSQFPSFQHNHHALIFLCDYLRIISLGNDNPAEIKALMDQEITVIENHEGHPGHAMHVLAEGLPALGIVAAVLGVIKTMGSITEPPEILGKMIGGALVGTFLGVWSSYAIAAPISEAMTAKGESKVMYYKIMRVGVLAYLSGAAPQVAVEFARKALPHEVQPSFLELEEILNELPSPG